ncbi:basic 7s globulin, partial [Quercus suber]
QNQQLLSLLSTHTSTSGTSSDAAATANSAISGSGSLDGLAKGTKGILGLGRTQITLPMQLANAFKLKRKFALCVPSSSQSGLGDIFIGGGPYYMLPYTKNVSELLITTPLIINPAVLKDFVKKAASRNITRVASVAPFGACFSSKTIASTITGPAVPIIDLVLQSKSVHWRIYGANSMVKVKENVLCLGVVDGGSKPRTSIVIGGHQLEDNMLEFDLASSKLGFSSSLLLHSTNCSHYRIF